MANDVELTEGEKVIASVIARILRPHANDVVLQILRQATAKLNIPPRDHADAATV